MLMADKMMELLTGREGVDSFVESLISTSKDFAEDHRHFEETIAYFRIASPNNITPSVDDLLNAIHRLISSQFVFAGYLGFQANVDHYLNPVARTFMEVDPEVYLRESVARTLPEYVSAKAIIDSFRSQLSSEQQEKFESVAMYIAHLETIIPKIAHYEGFLLGNDLLRYILPGYQPDVQLTTCYSWMLKEHMQ